MPKPTDTKSLRRTFAWLFPASGHWASADGGHAWRIRGSGVSRECEAAKTTNAIVEFLESAGIPVKRGGTSGFCAADTYSLEANFLDGGLSAETGNYIGQDKGAWIGGSRAALFVALGLGLRVPQILRDRYALTNATFEELKSEIGPPS
jgi:hypothetical protein